MGYDLTTPTKRLRLNMFTLPHILRLALGLGWEPMGTKNGHPSLSKNWAGDYLANNQQIILKEDAINLAKALELAQEPLTLPEHTPISPQEFKELLDEFIALCKEGNNITIS